MNINKKAKDSWKKLIVGKRLIYIWSSSRVPLWAHLRRHLKGISLLDATKKERAPFLEAEKIKEHPGGRWG